MNDNTPTGIDRAELLSRVENDWELAHELVAIFQADVLTYRDALRSAVESKSAEETRSAAHAFKGMLANLAASRASALAAHLEQSAKANEMEQVQGAWKSFEEELNNVLKDVQQLLAGAAK